MASIFAEAIAFLDKLGVYDVVLPFILVFAIVFGILEKTKILGTVEIEGKIYTKKNLNAIVSFVIALIVVASTRLVAVINKILADVVLLLLLSVFFLLLAGSFWKEEKEAVFLQKGWRTFFMIVIFFGIVLIFFNAIGWLRVIIDFMLQYSGSQWTATLLLIGILIFFMWFITRTPKTKGGE